MADTSFLDWPFLEPKHRALHAELEAWASQHLADVDHGDVDQSCLDLVASLRLAVVLLPG